MQLAPDGNIYIACKDQQMLTCITTPNNYHAEIDCDSTIQLSGTSKYGLPSFAASYFNPKAIGYTTDSCRKLTFSTNYSLAAGYAWNFGDTASLENTSSQQGPEHTYAFPGEYTVKLILTSDNGCQDTLVKTIILSDCDNNESISLSIPNVITPNNDGINDLFIIQNIDLIQENEVSILNRWGNLIYSTENYSNSKPFDGENCHEGVYFYFIVSKKTGERYSGTLTIIR